MKWIGLLLIGILSMSSSCGGEANEGTVSKPIASETAEVSKTTPSKPAIEEIGNIEGDVNISGTIASGELNNKKLYLYQSEGKEAFRIDSTVVKGGAFDFGKKTYKIGVYGIGPEMANMGLFIVNPSEGDLTMTFRNTRFKNAVRIPSSKDNTAWLAFERKKNSINQKMKNLRKKKSSAADPSTIDAQIDDAQYEMDEYRRTFVADNAMTFAAKMANHEESPFPASRSKYWNDLDFSDDSYVRSKVFMNRIQNYMRGFAGGSESGFYNCIDEIVAKAKEGENEVVTEHVLGAMMVGFWESGKEDISLYILDNYINEETCGADISDYMAAKADGMQKLRVGNKTHDFTVTDMNGKRVKMSEVAAKNEYTLLFFWASWCHKCEEEVPIINQNYPELSKKGFEVVSYSVDMSDADWKKAIETKQTPGLNVSELKGWESPVAKKYRVTSTPVYYLVDKDMNIVLKPERFFGVRDFLKGKL